MAEGSNYDYLFKVRSILSSFVVFPDLLLPCPPRLCWLVTLVLGNRMFSIIFAVSNVFLSVFRFIVTVCAAKLLRCEQAYWRTIQCSRGSHVMSSISSQSRPLEWSLPQDPLTSMERPWRLKSGILVSWSCSTGFGDETSYISLVLPNVPRASYFFSVLTMLYFSWSGTLSGYYLRVSLLP